MPFIEKRFLSRANWRQMNRKTHADDETAEVLLIGTDHCWQNASVVVGMPPNTTVEPTLSEFFALNQMTEPFTKIVAEYHGPQKAACGFISIANALVLCDVISQNKWWDRALSSNQDDVQRLLNAVTNPNLVIPKVQVALHHAATQRVDYMLNNPNCSASLKSSASQQNKYLSNWAAPFEISDCVREIFRKEGSSNDQTFLVSADEAKSKKSPFGPSPYPLSAMLGNNNKNTQIVQSISNLMFMRTNLYPIREQSKELQRMRIEQEDKQFGGQSMGGNVLRYNSGDSSYFVDLLASEKFSSSTSSPLSNTKFISPRNLLDRMQRVDGSKNPSHVCTKGCRVYIIDVIGHFCVLLCYIDASGCPHGIVINSASGDLSDMHKKPTVRVAFDLYVANVTDSFRSETGGTTATSVKNDVDGANSPGPNTTNAGDEEDKKKSGQSKDEAIDVDED